MLKCSLYRQLNLLLKEKCDNQYMNCRKMKNTVLEAHVTFQMKVSITLPHQSTFLRIKNNIILCHLSSQM